MPRNYIGGLKGVTPLAGDPVDLRTSGVFNLGSLGGDRAASGDADFDSVVLLLDGDGTSGSTTFTDESSSPHTITVNGDVQVYGSKYGTGSIKFDGAGDYLEVDFQNNIGVSRDPFTVECWVYFDTLNDEGVINLTQGGFGQGSNSLAIGYYTSQWRFYDDNAGTATGVTPGPSTGQWYHTAIVFDGTDLVFYIDGQARLTRSNHFSNMPAGGYPTVIFGGYYGAGYELDGKIDDIRVTKGAALYSSNFTPPTSALTNTVSSGTVVLRLNGDGTSGSTTFIDQSSSTNTITANGDVQVIAPKYGTGSIKFDGAGDYLDVSVNSDFTFDGDFTVEAWVYPNTAGTFMPIIDGRANNAAFQNYYFGLTNVSQTLRTDLILASGGTGRTGTTNAVPTGQWSHIAFVRNNGVITPYVNGVADATTKSDGTTLTPSNFRVGATPATTGPQYYFDGYIDDLRVTKGVARYTSNFTPPTSALSADVSDITGSDDVVLLLDGTSVNDGSTGGLNDATLQADASANDTTVTDPYGGSTGSYKLDGTGDYLSISDDDDFHMGSGDFTAECWAYFNSLSTTEPFIMGQWSGTLNVGTLNWAIMLSTNTGYVRFITSSNGNGVLFDLSTSTTSFSLSTSTWYHIAAVRNGSSFKIFVDGVERASTTNTSALYNATNAFTIGAESDGQEQAMNGYLKDIRVTKGAALYPFHPPASALPTTGAVAGATRPTRKWGGLVGRSILVSELPHSPNAAIFRGTTNQGSQALSINGTAPTFSGSDRSRYHTPLYTGYYSYSPATAATSWTAFYDWEMNATNYPYLASYGTTSGAVRRFYTQGTDIRVYRGGGSTYPIMLSGLTDGQRYRAAFRWDGTNLKSYLVSGTAEITALPTASATTTEDFDLDGNTHSIGVNSANNVAAEDLDSPLYAYAFYNSDLTDAQMLDVFNVLNGHVI